MVNNYAFIDAQNVHRGMVRAGWALDWHKFRDHLQHHYDVTRAYIFVGYVQANESL
jgi:endonuclease YncB( thermonuclease family)